MSRTGAAARGDADDRPDPGPDRAPLLPRPERLDRPDRRSPVPADGHLPPAVPDVVGAELVPLQAREPAATRLSVEHRRPGGAGQPQPPGGHRPGEPAGEPDLGILSGEDRPRPGGRLAA